MSLLVHFLFSVLCPPSSVLCRLSSVLCLPFDRSFRVVLGKPLRRFCFRVPAPCAPESRMKLPAFEYACPATLAEAVALLAAGDGDAKVLAGGQSLGPMMAFRIASPALLVDLRKLAALRRVHLA